MTYDILFEIRLERTGKERYDAKLRYDVKVYGDEIGHAVSKMVQDLMPFIKLARKIPSELPSHDIIEISRLRGDMMMWRGIYRDARTVESYVVYGYGWQGDGYEDLIVCKLTGEEQYCYTTHEMPKPNTSTGIIITASELLKAFHVATMQPGKKTEVFAMGKIIRIVL